MSLANEPVFAAPEWCPHYLPQLQRSPGPLYQDVVPGPVWCVVTSCRWPGGGGRGRGGPDTLAPPPPDTGAPPRHRSLSGQVTGQVQVHHYYQMMNRI